MIDIPIPGRTPLCLSNLVMDYNGTLAVDGHLIDGVAERIERLAKQLSVKVITADTFGLAGREMAGLPADLVILPEGSQDQGKLAYIESLGPSGCVCVGNGINDALMLKEAALGIALILDEGASVSAVLNADIVCRSVLDALDLLLNPKRLVATLRR